MRFHIRAKMKRKCNENVHFSVGTMNVAKRRGVHSKSFTRLSPDLSLNECNLPSALNNLLRGLRDACVSDIHYNDTKAIKCSVCLRLKCAL